MLHHRSDHAVLPVPAGGLERPSEKWEPVFKKVRRENKNPEHRPASIFPSEAPARPLPVAAVTGRVSAPAPHQPPLRPVPGVKGTAAALSERCSAVQTLVQEMAALASERVAMRRSRRRSRCHVRQIAMYLCHVVLQMSLTDIGAGFGRDRTTAGHACNVVEDLRDDPVYDAFLSTLERVVQAVFPRAAQGGAIDA